MSGFSAAPDSRFTAAVAALSVTPNLSANEPKLDTLQAVELAEGQVASARYLLHRSLATSRALRHRPSAIRPSTGLAAESSANNSDSFPSAEGGKKFARHPKASQNPPGIVTIHDSGRVDGLYYLLMEFVDGLNLRQLLQAGRVSPRKVLAIVPDICDALQYAHDAGIVHRDIKPALRAAGPESGAAVAESPNRCAPRRGRPARA